MADLPDDEYEERVERARLARREARETINEQTSTLSDIDEKAIRIFRANMILTTIIVSSVSIAVSLEDGSPSMLFTPYTKTAAVLLFSSTLLSAITYTSTSERIGVSRADISESILNQEYDYDLVEEEIAMEYGEWIQYNYERNASNALLFTLALFTVVASICYLAIGLIDVYNDGMITAKMNFVVLLFFLIFGKLSGVYGQTIRWWRMTSPGKRFSNWCRGWVNKVRGNRAVEAGEANHDGDEESEQESAEDDDTPDDPQSGQVT